MGTQEVTSFEAVQYLQLYRVPSLLNVDFLLLEITKESVMLYTDIDPRGET